jgi:hypothetical protein
MSQNIPSPSDLHRVAATDHETAAKLHRDTADLHDQHSLDEAKIQASASLEQSSQAHSQSIAACHSSCRLPT